MRPWPLLLLIAACTGVVPVDKGEPDDTDTQPTDDTDPSGDDTDPPGDDTDPSGDDTDETDVDPVSGDPVATMGPGDLLITEVMIDPSACIDDDAEYVEIYNVSGRDVDLTGLVLTDGGTRWTAGAYVLRAGGYAVLWRTPLPGGSQCYGLTRGLPYASALALSNLGERLTVEDSAGEVLDTMSWAAGQVTTGRALQLDAGSLDATANDAPSAWCASEDLIGATTDRGTPGAANIACAVDTDDSDPFIDTDDTDLPPAGTGDLLLTEVADPVVFDARYVEIHNVGSTPVGLAAYSVYRYSNGSTTPQTFALPAVNLAPGAFYVVAANAGVFQSEWGFAPDTTWSGVNGNGDDVYALAENGTVVDVFGVVGVDGTGEPWEYTDASASRDPSVVAPRNPMVLGEWFISGDFSPGAAAGAPPVDTGDSADSWDSVWWDSGETGDTADTDVVDTWTDTDSPPLGGGPSLILSEIADPVNNNARFVEVTNVGNRPFDLGTVELQRYSNGSTTPSAQDLDAVSLAPGDSWVIAYSGNGFSGEFGFAADQTWNGVNANGNDVYALATNGVVFDVYGVIGVDGVGEPWEFTDLGATRRDRVTEASDVFRIGEWDIGAPHTPGTHAYVATPDTDTDVPDTGDSGVVDTDDTDVVDTDVVDTDVVDTDVVDTDVVDTDVIDTDVIDTDVIDTDVVHTGDSGDTDVVDTAFTAPTLFLSEVADPTVFQQRFVEIANPTGAVVDLTGWTLTVYFNGNTSGTAITLVGTVAPGDVFVIAYDAARFESAYGFPPDQTSGSINSNGDDVYALSYDDGTGDVLVDVYGEIGVDGTGQPWEFLDLIASRVPGIVAPSTVWIQAEWSLAAAGETPGAHPL